MARDTDKDWSEIPKSLPYYGVLANDRFRNPGETELREFFETGERDIQFIYDLVHRIFGEFRPKTALDFGCGVGRLLLPLARICGTGTGVDVADGMLELARRHCNDEGIQVNLTKVIPVNEQFDWVNTIIVLQHIPPLMGYDLIKQLWQCVAPDGLLSMQLTIYRDQRHMGEINRDINRFRFDGETLRNYTAESDTTVGMTMYDYDLSRVFSCLDLADGQAVHMMKTDHGGCHGFAIYIRKR